MVPSDALVALDNDRSPLVLHRKILSNSSSTISHERVRATERIGHDDGVEQVVECGFEDVGGTDVGGERLVVSGCWSMERFNCFRRIDACSPRVLLRCASVQFSQEYRIGLTRSRTSTAF